MRGIWLSALGLVLACSHVVRAGVYNSRENLISTAQTAQHRVKSTLDLWRAMPMNVGDLEKEPVTKACRELFGIDHRQIVKELEAKRQEGKLSYQEFVDLGACYYRLLDFDASLAVLKEANRSIPEDWGGRFQLHCNLAATYHSLADQQAEFFNGAQLHQQQALDSWPEVWAGWSVAELWWYRRVEMHYLRLLELRKQESRTGDKPSQGPDNLFRGVRFVGEDGKYRAGSIALRYFERLPLDVLNITIQLAYWRPFDDRVYRLLGELYNASSRVKEAYDVFDDLWYSRNLREETLHAHRRATRVALEVAKELRLTPAELASRALEEVKESSLTPTEKAKRTKELEKVIVRETGKGPMIAFQMFGVFAPRGADAGSVAGSAAQEIIWAALERIQSPRDEPAGPAEPSSPAAGDDRLAWLTRPRVAAVAFAAGGLFTLLLIWQIGQWSRRLSSGVMDRRFEEG